MSTSSLVETVRVVEQSRKELRKEERKSRRVLTDTGVKSMAVMRGSVM